MAFCGLTLAANGQGVLFDQANTSVSPWLGYRYWALSYQGAAPIGQEFVPALSSLDFVDLMLYGGGGTATGSFAVTLHPGNITAPALATV